MIRVDASACSVVVACTLCRGWSELASSRADGWKIAAAHERRLHPELDQAKHALREQNKRHAAK